jgi:hypothetical protein
LPGLGNPRGSSRRLKPGLEHRLAQLLAEAALERADVLNIDRLAQSGHCRTAMKPSVEQQAIACAHRMGQTRRVQVHRLLAKDGVDERIREV